MSSFPRHSFLHVQIYTETFWALLAIESWEQVCSRPGELNWRSLLDERWNILLNHIMSLEELCRNQSFAPEVQKVDCLGVTPKLRIAPSPFTPADDANKAFLFMSDLHSCFKVLKSCHLNISTVFHQLRPPFVKYCLVWVEEGSCVSKCVWVQCKEDSRKWWCWDNTGHQEGRTSIFLFMSSNHLSALGRSVGFAETLGKWESDKCLLPGGNAHEQ